MVTATALCRPATPSISCFCNSNVAQRATSSEASSCRCYLVSSRFPCKSASPASIQRRGIKVKLQRSRKERTSSTAATAITCLANAPENWRTSLSYEQIAQLQAQEEESRFFRYGPPPGDVAEVEAFCRIYRLSQRLHSAVMDALRQLADERERAGKEEGPKAEEAAGPPNGPLQLKVEGDVPEAEERVVAALALLSSQLLQGRENVLGRPGVWDSQRAHGGDASQFEEFEDDLPPLATLRKEVREACNHLQEALEAILPGDMQYTPLIRRRLDRVRNICLDAGFPRLEGAPHPADIPNFAEVRLQPLKQAQVGGIMDQSNPPAFWRGGNLTQGGLEWLVDKGFKAVVDLRAREWGQQWSRPVWDTETRIHKYNIPIEYMENPRPDQVEEFAKIVADPANQPMYVFSVGGTGRTCAIVAAWREYVLKSLGKAAELTGSTRAPGTPEVSSIMRSQWSRASSERSWEEGIPFQESSQGTLSFFYSGWPNWPSTKSSEALEVPATEAELESSDDEELIESETEVETSVVEDPLEAQRPKLNLFPSRSMALKAAMQRTTSLSVFERRRKALLRKNVSVDPLPPQNEGMKQQAWKDDSLDEEQYNKWMIRKHVPGEDGTLSGVAGRWGRAPGAGIPRADSGHPTDTDSESDCPEAELELPSTAQSTDNVSEDLTPSTSQDTETGNGNGKLKEDGNGFWVVDEGVARLVEEPTAVEEEVGPVEVPLPYEGGDMCSSTTGVVRLQSRKKAEMYLVRTDGYTCTREKVRESTLAFTHPSTQQQMLMWKTPPKTVMLLKKLGDDLLRETEEVAMWLHHQQGMNIVVEPDVHDKLIRSPGFEFVETYFSQDIGTLHERVDFVVCLGGDGVILHVSNLFIQAVPPVVSFNLGSLGFLTTHQYKDFREDLRAVIHGNRTMEGVYITLRMRLRCEIYRQGVPIPGKVFEVLNEVVVDRGASPYLCKIECYERNRLITKVQADGVLLATPTGSTAYSVAAGGSMVHPNVPCILFTPICPHSLSFRPVILPDSAEIELKVPNDARNTAWVCFDGKKRQQLMRGDSVKIRMSEHPMPTVNKYDQTDDWFRSLVRCLNWNERLEQKAFSFNIGRGYVEEGVAS